MKRKSIARRAIAAVLLIESLCAVAFISTLLWHEWRTRVRALDAVIEGRSDSLIGAVQDLEDPGNNVFVDPQEFALPPGDVYAVYDPSGKLVGASQPAVAALQAMTRDGVRTARANGESYRVMQRQALRIIDREETKGVGRRRPVIVVYAARTDRLWSEVVQATRYYALVSVVLLCSTAVVLIWLLRRLLLPLEELAASASGIKADSLTFTAPQSTSQIRELAPLTDALTEMMARVRAAFESQHQFMHDAAHELKTAVAIVRSTIQVLGMRERSAEEYRRGLDQVLADNERVESLVREMLTLANAEERGTSVRGVSDLAAGVERAANRLQSMAQARGIAMERRLEAGLKVGLSAEAVERIATNLALNALQYSPAGSIVELSVKRVGDEPTHAELCVNDSGTGIAPENLPRVFERFYREDPSRARATGGTGLGLSICKSLVDAALGTIEVKSAPGAGTTVTVKLPTVPRMQEAHRAEDMAHARATTR